MDGTGASLQKLHSISLEKPADRVGHIVMGKQYGIGGPAGEIAIEKPSRSGWV
jgi:hypothetical protein